MTLHCLHLEIEGLVQGVGFRPFIYRLAKELGLKGWVSNTARGAAIEVEGGRPDMESFIERMKTDKPPLAIIERNNIEISNIKNYKDFVIKQSDDSGQKAALVLPDIATCPDCLKEIFDPGDRRYLYPFTNCTNCGPRYSIIEALPYDRANTTMKVFEMCDRCRAEYENPLDRRFHAQPNACPECGPYLQLLNHEGEILAAHHEALLEATAAIRQGRIVALKGLGGFQLIVDARNDDAVKRLRLRKGREEKPFAMMYPGLAQIEEDCEISGMEAGLLKSYQSPIVLLRRLADSSSGISSHNAPGNPYLGVMLPYTPLHHILLRQLQIPVVATSGNRSDEPICIGNSEAIRSLGGIADLFLVHNRTIARHVDDSVVRIIAGREMVIRRARGYAPMPINLDRAVSGAFAAGAHLKNTAAMAIDNRVILTQHIGDLDNEKAYNAYRNSINSLANIYEYKPLMAIKDKHPDYLSSQYASQLDVSQIEVQHHLAHIYSCMAENGLEPPVLGVAWDGTGMGDDGSIWGGEFFSVDAVGYKRLAHLRTFRLPGGEQAIRVPRRAAIGLLYEIYDDTLADLNDIAAVSSFSPEELKTLIRMLGQKVNSPLTSSAGRLFDSVSAIVGIRQINKFEGQAAMELEFAMGHDQSAEQYEFESGDDGVAVIDWRRMIQGIIADLRLGLSAAKISVKFHNTLVETIVDTAKKHSCEKIVLSGGCFQNKYLSERTIVRLTEEGFEPYWHRIVPPNDGGISLGQIAALNYSKRGVN